MDRIPIGEQPDNVVPFRGAAEGKERGAAEGKERAAEPEDPGADDADPGEQEMSYEEAMAADPSEDDDHAGTSEEPPPVPGGAMAGLLEQGVRVGTGLFAAGATAFAGALRASMAGDEAREEERDPAATLAGAGLGAAVTAAEAAAAAATDAADAVAPLITWLVEPRFAKDAAEVAAGATRVLDGRWQAAQAETAEAARSFLSALVPEIVEAALDQVDLTALVRERLDVDAIAADLDIDAIVAKVDVDRVVDRVDVDRVVDRVDLTSVVDRLDLSTIAQEVIDDVDLPTIIRDSSGAMAGEGVQTVRVQGMNADRLVSRIVDKVLRREARDLDPPTEG